MNVCSLNAGRRCSAHCKSDDFSCIRSAKSSSSLGTKKILYVSILNDIYMCIYFKQYIHAHSQAVVRLVNLLICVFSYFNNIFCTVEFFDLATFQENIFGIVLTDFSVRRAKDEVVDLCAVCFSKVITDLDCVILAKG